jgi:hypothetical protein
VAQSGHKEAGIVGGQSSFGRHAQGRIVIDGNLLDVKWCRKRVRGIIGGATRLRLRGGLYPGTRSYLMRTGIALSAIADTQDLAATDVWEDLR